MRMRPATARDLPGAYRVCFETADPAGPARAWTDHELIGHVYVGPYFFGPGTVALVLVDAAGVAGYCLGAADTEALDRWARAEWWPALRADHPLTADHGEPERELVEMIHDPPTPPPAVVAGYPAHLHIDLLPRAQGAGHGRRLIEELGRRLRVLGAGAVHLGVGADNAHAIAFYRHLGFVELDEAPGVRYLGRALDGPDPTGPT